MLLPFRGQSLQRSVSFTTGMLVVVLMGTTLLAVKSRVGAALRDGLEARGVAIAQSIGAVATPSLLAYNYAALQIAAQGAAENPSVAYVVIHDKEGAPAGAAGRLPVDSRKSAHVDAKATVNSTFEVVVEDDAGLPHEVLEVAVPVHVDGVAEPWGTVRVGLDRSIVDAQMRPLFWQLLGLGALLTLAAVIIGLWIARLITAPLRRLAHGTEALSRGDLGYRIPLRGAKEMRDLAQSFNAMIDRLQAKALESDEFQRALELLNSTLEQQVRERTRALEESTAQYKTLVDHSPDSIVIVQDGAVRFVNRAFTETFGVHPGEAASEGFRLGRIFESSSAALAAGRIAAWERGESASPTDILGRDASGRTRHLQLRGSRIEYQGRPAAECLLVDMTEAKRLREQLNETEKLRALGEMASGVAHDFNNLLGAVLGRVQLLRRRAFPADVDFEMAVIEKAAQDGRETVRRIQEFSRTRRDRRFEAVDLSEVLRDAMEITRTRWQVEAQRRNVTVDAKLEVESVPPILGNAAELREVFTNLILNAVDAMPQGGKLRLECRRDGDRVVACCSDSGVGMTEEIRQHLFDPFFTTKGNRGMGLGMSVVYGIVTRHEGRIEVATALGKGSSFTLVFPVVENAVPRPAGGDGAALPNIVRPGRILVIDDESEIAEIVRDVLLAAGHSVDMATSGKDGVQRVTVSPYDLVFTDLGMPDMSGWEVAERIGSLRPGLPVALVTGWGTSLDEDEARKKGVVAVVHKPFEIDELVRVATRLLASR